MKKFTLSKCVLTAITILSMAAILTGCGGSEGNKADTIKLGANLELTGNSASYGASAKNGIEMAVKEINDNGGLLGKKVEVDFADNRSEATEAANAMQKLLDDKVDLIVGPDTSSGVLACVSTADKEKIPLLTPFGTNPDITVDPATKQVRPYVFRAAFIDTFQGKVMATFVTNQLHAKTAAVYVDNSSDYSKGLQKFFVEEFQKSGGNVVASEAYLQKDTDFKAALTKIKAANPDVIFVPGYYQEVGMIIKQAREMGITQPIVGGDGWDSSKLAEIAGAANLENCYFANHYSADDTSEKVKTFVANYQKAYNQKADAPAALAYDSVMIVAKAIKDANSIDKDKVREALGKIKDFDVVSGKITFNEFHDPVKSAVILTFKGGQQAFVTKIAP
ncbi:ABC transporter substrate-binding protein [Megasphaera sueciensis]|jgi:branched-chain amino acid transport system substrate-binding protein|uniref:ABC transporter substrate-binding protein n=1 Tax=Megasphaera sueciensis TaxID=349094 RepID=UPI003D0869AF